MKLKHTKQSGFSIIEAIITLAIVILILVLYQSAVNTINLTRNSENEETALRIASVKIEELRAGGYSSVPATGSFSSSQLSALPSGSGNLVVTDFSANVKQVTVNVQWLDTKTSTTRTITLTTAIADLGGL